METSHSAVDYSSSREDDDAPPPVHLVVAVLDTDLDDTKSQTAPSNEIINTYNKPSFTMETLHSAVDCLSTLEDNHAPPSSVPLVVDVLDKDRDDVSIESSTRMTMAYDEFREILSWVPAKSAIKYSSSLCKWLCNIHSESRFIQKQCIRSCGQDSGFFLQHKKSKNDRVSNEFEFHVLQWETGSAFEIPFQSLDFLPESGRIFSSSNGLLLLHDPATSEFKVCNPATRQWAPLHIPKGMKGLADEGFSPVIECYPWGHGLDDNVEFPNDYTIALPVCFSMMWQMAKGRLVRIHKQKLVIYSHGRWDEELCEVSIEGRIVRFDMPVVIFSNANKGLIVHYMCDSGPPSPYYPDYLEPYIAAFNIREKKLLRKIKLPEGAWDKDIAEMYGPSEKKLWIFKWNEMSICLVRWWVGHSKMVAWVLEDYGSEGESWRLVMDTSESELWPDKHSGGSCIMSVGVANGGKGLLIATRSANYKKVPTSSAKRAIFSRVYVYLVDQGRLELVGDHHFGIKRVLSADDAPRFISYANTLRPVSAQNAETQNLLSRRKKEGIMGCI